MSAQDKTEQVLRDIHILFSKCEIYDKSANKVIVNKQEVLDLLNRLNICIYEIMDEYELTQQSRDKAEREARRKGDEIVWDASRKAEDVYAASVLYTDEALRRVQDIMQTATDSVKEIYERMSGELKKEREIVNRDQSELKGHLQDLVDTEKYLKLIEERNKEIAREKMKGKKEPEEPAFTPVKPEIKVNMEYFEKAGIPLDEQIIEEETEKEEIDLDINLDEEYFQWIEEETTEKKVEKKPEKISLFGKILKGDKD